MKIQPSILTKQKFDPDSFSFKRMPEESILCDMVNNDVDLCKSSYSKWVEHDVTLSASRDVPGVLQETVVWTASKRGNKQYVSSVKTRLSEYNATLPLMSFFDPIKKYDEYVFLRKSHQLARYKRPMTSLLYFVLTVDPKKLSRFNSWRLGNYRYIQSGPNRGKRVFRHDFNRFRSALVRYFGCKVSIIRFNESQDNGYAHYNLVLQLDKLVPVFPYFNKYKREVSWRLPDKGSLEKYWPHGFISVQALARVGPYGSDDAFNFDSKGAIKNNGCMPLSHMFKYISKDMSDPFDRMSNPRTLIQTSMLWATRTRTFSLSGNFRAMFAKDVLDVLELKVELQSLDLIDTKGSLIQTNSSKFQLIGMFPACSKHCFKDSGKPPPSNCPFLNENKEFGSGRCAHLENYNPGLADYLYHQGMTRVIIARFLERQASEWLADFVSGFSRDVVPGRHRKPVKTLVCDRIFKTFLKNV